VSEEAKAIVRRFVEEIRARANLEAVDEFIAEDCVNQPPPPGGPPDREGAKQIFAMFRAAFRDHDAVILDMVGEDDTVATYKTFTGTHQGEYMGIPATTVPHPVRLSARRRRSSPDWERRCGHSGPRRSCGGRGLDLGVIAS
jgi:predicted ester cyclase